MNAPAGRRSHWVMRMARSMSASRGVQLVQVPSKPAIGTRFRQAEVPRIENRTGQEVLGGSIEPAQHEKCVLAGRRATPLQPPARSAAQRMITTALRVEERAAV